MTIAEKAVGFHACGYNCAQCVLKACREFYPELDDNTLARLASGFGGGVCCGEICGALTGGVMAIGLSNSFDESSREAVLSSKETLKKLIQSYNQDFKDNFDSLLCARLKGGKFSCNELIAFSAEAAEKMILNNK